MAGPLPEPPRIRSIVAGIGLFVLLLVIVWTMSDVVKLAGAPFLIIPDMLGLVDRVSPDEVVRIQTQSSPTPIEHVRPGRYAVFTADTQLLAISNDSIDAKATPWLKVISVESGEEIPVAFVTRGLRPYDTHLAKGRPVFTFEIPSPGRYELVHPRREAVISIVPNVTTGKESLLALAYLAQVAAIVLPFALPSLRRTQKRRARRRALQREKRALTDAFWETRLKK